MKKRLMSWRNYARGAALLALAAGFMSASAAAREELNCTACHEVEGKYKCELAAKDEPGNTGICTERKTGCGWGLGEDCKGTGDIGGF
jgi:hypothetical protein